MKAIECTKYGPPEVLQIKQIKKPAPLDNEVLVRIAAATVTPSDCVAREGTPLFARLFSGLTKPKFAVPGVEFAGEVESVGKNVKRFKAGDRIIGIAGLEYGAYAEYKCLPEDGVMIAKPSRLDFFEGALLCDGGLTALSFLKDAANIQKGQKVLINGASGAVGTCAVQLAKHFGAYVTAVCSSANVALVRSLGADEVIDYTKEDFTKSGHTYDVIFDAVGKSSFSRCKAALGKTGMYLTTIPTPAILMQMLWTKKSHGKRAVFAATGLNKADRKISDLQYLAGLAESGSLKPVVDRVYPFEQVAQAHEYVGKGHKKGGVALTVALGD